MGIARTAALTVSLGLGIAACSGSPPAAAVPAPVEIEWPDAAISPNAVDPAQNSVESVEKSDLNTESPSGTRSLRGEDVTPAP
jgi:ABC-type glycerol-3-phosphate transport system substrate-binding protein